MYYKLYTYLHDDHVHSRHQRQSLRQPRELGGGLLPRGDGHHEVHDGEVGGGRGGGQGLGGVADFRCLEG